MGDNNLNKIIMCGKEERAFWVPDSEHKTFKKCSKCGFIHKQSQGALPNVCPGCGLTMVKGHNAAKFLSIAKALQDEEDGDVVILNGN